jgi:hypothetical protein
MAHLGTISMVSKSLAAVGPWQPEINRLGAAVIILAFMSHILRVEIFCTVVRRELDVVVHQSPL